MVSAGRLDAVTDSFGCVTGSAPISWKNFARASAQSPSSIAERHGHDDLRVELGDQLRGLRRAERAADRHARDVDRADVAELLLRSRWPISPRWIVWSPSSSTTKDALAALGALGVVAVRANAGDEDLLDLVLAGAVEDERRVEAGG